MLQRDAQLMATGGWMTDAHAMDLRVFPRKPVEVNIATVSETLQLWHHV